MAAVVTVARHGAEIVVAGNNLAAESVRLAFEIASGLVALAAFAKVLAIAEFGEAMRLLRARLVNGAERPARTRQVARAGGAIGMWYDPEPRTMRRYPSSYASSFSFGPGPLSSALKALIGANVAVFLAQRSFDPTLTEAAGAEPAAGDRTAWVWQLATYMFLHGGLFHILFNMLALWMFGTELERMWGTRYFVKFYFVTGIGAGMLTVLFSLLPFEFTAPALQVRCHRRVRRDLRICCSPTRCTSRIGRSTCISVSDSGEDTS